MPLYLSTERLQGLVVGLGLLPGRVEGGLFPATGLGQLPLQRHDRRLDLEGLELGLLPLLVGTGLTKGL